MSKRNGYTIYLTNRTELDAIISALESTEIVVEVSDSIQNKDNITITAEDAPSAGSAFRDHTKGPDGYIFWPEIKQTLSPYTNTIKKIQHTLSDDTGCFTKTTKYEVTNGEFTQVSQTKEDHIR